MQKQISSKKIIAVICAAAVVVVTAAVVFLLNNREEAFRSILVYELEGSAVIERADIGEINAVANLYLESGDRVNVHQDSMMRMKLDDDKYITAEADTIFALEAEGNGHDSKTKIRLEQGAITNEIQNPLNSESLYETSTPNSVMAVRGTIYRAELSDDGAGGQDMKICCFEGTVATMPILPDGTRGEEVLVHAGSELTVYSDGSVDGPKDIDFDSLPEQALQTLLNMSESGATIKGISIEELDRLVHNAGQTDVDSEAAEDVKEPVTEEALDIEEQEIEEQDAEPTAGDSAKAADQKRQTADAGRKAANGNRRKDTASDGNTQGSDAQQKPVKSGNTTPASGSPSNMDGSGSSDGGNGQDNGSDKNPGDNSGSKPAKPNKPSKPDEPDKEVVYTVTFEYQGSVFASQNVQEGNKATEPMLTPAKEGGWDFDFDTQIKADTTIRWKSGN